MEPKKDRLEEYFRKSLEGLSDKASPGGWDLPSEHVWKGIESGIPAVVTTGVKTIIIKYAIFTAAASTVGLATIHMYNQSKEVRELQQEIVQKDKVIEDLNEALLEERNQPEQPETNISDQQNSTQLTDINESASETSLPSAPEYFDQDSKRVSADRDLLKPESLSGGTTRVDNKPLNTGSNAGTAGPVSQENVTASRLGSLNPLNWKSPFLNTANQIPTLNYTWNTIKPVVGAYSNPASVSAFISPAYAYRSVYHKQREISTPYEKTESPEFSFTGGVNFGIPVGRNLSLGSGIHYSSFHQHSKHIVGLRFTTMGGTKDANGNHVNKYRTKLETSYGLVEVESRVSSDIKSTGTAVNEGRVFPIRYTADLHIKQLSIPLYLQYHIGHQRLGMMLKGGIAGTFLLSNNLDISNVSSLNKELKHLGTSILEEKTLPATKDFTLDLYASVGFRASLSKNLDVMVEPTFRKNITPVFENSTLETRMFSLALHSGLAIKF